MSTAAAPTLAPTLTDRLPMPLVAGRIALYDLTGALADLDAELVARADEIAANGGALPDDLASAFDALELAWDAKAERIALMVRERRVAAESAVALAQAIETEPKRLRALAKSRAAEADGLLEYLLGELRTTGRTLKTDRVTLSLARVKATVRVQPSAVTLGDDALPPEIARFARLVPGEPERVIPATPGRYVLDADLVEAEWAARFADAEKVAKQVLGRGASDRDRWVYAEAYANAGMPDGCEGGYAYRVNLR